MFCAGSMVLLQNSRRDSKRGNPNGLVHNYVIVESLGKSRYRLKNPCNNNILKNSVHSVRLKPYKTTVSEKQVLDEHGKYLY